MLYVFPPLISPSHQKLNKIVDESDSLKTIMNGLSLTLNALYCTYGTYCA